MLFADHVRGRYSYVHDRGGLPPHWPTDRQAEALYPDQVHVSALQKIYVRNEATLDDTAGVVGGLLPTVIEVPVIHAPKVFE